LRLYFEINRIKAGCIYNVSCLLIDSWIILYVKVATINKTAAASNLIGKHYLHRQMLYFNIFPTTARVISTVFLFHNGPFLSQFTNAQVISIQMSRCYSRIKEQKICYHVLGFMISICKNGYRKLCVCIFFCYIQYITRYPSYIIYTIYIVYIITYL